MAPSRSPWLALGLLCVVQFMVVLDIAIVNVALPSIKVDLGFSQGDLQWVISAYALVFGGFLLLGGRAADILGRRRVFLGGVAVFTIASLLAGMAWSDGSLIAARAVQGLGAAIITPAALSILSTTFVEGRERNIALGAWGAVGGFGAVAGVLLGGVLTDALSWEWIFFVNVPVGVAAFVIAPFLLQESRDAHVKRFDLPGAVLVTGGLSTLVYAVTQAGQQGWLAGETLAFFGLAAALLAGFVGWELRHPDPLMRFGILRTRTVSGANVAGFIMGTAMFSMFLMLTLYMQQVLGYSPMRTGVAYLAVAGTAILWSAAAAQLVTRVGVKPVLVVGMTTLTGGPRVLHAGVRQTVPTWVTCSPASCSSGSGSDSPSCPSRSPRSRESRRRRRDSRPGSSTPRSRSAEPSASPSCRRSRPLAPRTRSAPARRSPLPSSTASPRPSSSVRSSPPSASSPHSCSSAATSSRTWTPTEPLGGRARPRRRLTCRPEGGGGPPRPSSTSGQRARWTRPSSQTGPSDS